MMQTQTRVAERSHPNSEVLGISTELREALIAIAKHVQTQAEPFPPLTPTALTTHSLESPSLSQENDAIFVNDEDLLGDLE